MFYILQGTPAIVSLPLFYLGNASDVDRFIGVHPTKEEHETFLDVEPVSNSPKSL